MNPLSKKVTRRELEKCLNKCYYEVLELKIDYDIKLDESITKTQISYYTQRINELEYLMKDIERIINREL